MRGCRGGVSPCAGLGGSPDAADSVNQKRTERSQSFRAGAEGRPRWKRQVPRTARKAASPGGPCWVQGERPHPTSLRSATFPGGGGCRLGRSSRGKRRVAQRQGKRPRPAGHAGCTGNDLIRPRCARPPSPEGKAKGFAAVREENGRFAQLTRSDLSAFLRPRRAAASSDLAALGHLPQRGRLCAGPQFVRKTAVSAMPREPASPGGPCWVQGERPHPTSLRSATFPRGKAVCCDAVRPRKQ